MLARGAVISALVSLFLMPAILCVCEPVFHKTSLNWRTLPPAKAPRAQRRFGRRGKAPVPPQPNVPGESAAPPAGKGARRPAVKVTGDGPVCQAAKKAVGQPRQRFLIFKQAGRPRNLCGRPACFLLFYSCFQRLKKSGRAFWIIATQPSSPSDSESRLRS